MIFGLDQRNGAVIHRNWMIQTQNSVDIASLHGHVDVVQLLLEQVSGTTVANTSSQIIY